mmetsp:Transcript_15619/g.23666  ORF Transcript_15619/g.23666 Transcript_15619/m.23666 type:complete len:259 (+) Transcript_15619:99-875(+)
MQSRILFTVFLTKLIGGSCFSPTTLVTKSWKISCLSMSSGKGFDDKPSNSDRTKPKADKTEIRAINEAPVSPESLNRGQQNLLEMRRQKAEQRDAELRKIKELREIDQAVAETPAAIPEKVAMRMGQRMIPFVGIPLFLGLGSFVVFWYLATYKDMEFQPVTVAFTSIALLAVGLLGITYSIFSTSWDEDREGDILGLEEAKRNLDNVKEGLGRSRENALLRDKIAGISEPEIDRAIADLNRRDGKKIKKTDLQELQD